MVMPFAPFVGDNFIFMQDIARPHVARDVLDYPRFVDWPRRNRDMKPIEHLRDVRKRSVRRNILVPMNLKEIKQVVLAGWENIPRETIRNLTNSMPPRIEVG